MSQEIKTVFKYNGNEFEFDARDADCAEALENAFDKMSEEEEKIPKTGKSSEIIRGQCKLLKDFFDRIFGKGAGEAICTEKNNVVMCYNAYDEFLKLVREQKDDIINTKNTFGKYSNRQQRRAANKK